MCYAVGDEMKIILSRKGFDSSNGGCPSPILPDGTLLSMPIPSNDRDTYEDLFCRGVNYAELLRQLRPGKLFSHCHVDPDLRPGLRVSCRVMFDSSAKAGFSTK